MIFISFWEWVPGKLVNFINSVVLKNTNWRISFHQTLEKKTRHFKPKILFVDDQTGCFFDIFLCLSTNQVLNELIIGELRIMDKP